MIVDQRTVEETGVRRSSVATIVPALRPVSSTTIVRAVGQRFSPPSAFLKKVFPENWDRKYCIKDQGFLSFEW